VIRLARFLGLAAPDRRLLLRALCALAAARVGLLFLPLRTVHGIAADGIAFHGIAARRASGAARPATPGARPGFPAPDRPSAERIAWAVRAAARYVPGATCLPQALAARFLLARHGHPARLRIGVAVTDERAIAGHAWVESDAGVVLAGAEVARYAALPALEPEPAARGGAPVGAP
jgi:hypothetical protein